MTGRALHVSTLLDLSRDGAPLRGHRSRDMETVAPADSRNRMVVHFTAPSAKWKKGSKMNKPPIEIDGQGPRIVRAFLILAAALLMIVIAAVELGAFRGLAPGDIGFYPPPPAAPYH